jgi:hypothetical protein
LNIMVFKPETETSSIYWVHPSRFNLKTETESSVRNLSFEMNATTMDSVQNCDNSLPCSRSRSYRWINCMTSRYQIIKLLLYILLLKAACWSGFDTRQEKNY